jgi:predicted acyltransferase (DUF342 family)
MPFDKRTLVLPPQTAFEERTIVTTGDLILGNHVKAEFGLQTDGRVFTGQGAEIEGHVRCDGDARLDQSTSISGDIVCKANVYLAERCFIQGDLDLEGDLDVGDDVRIGGQLKAKGWVNKRNPVPLVLYIFIYLLELLRLGKSEEVERILKDLEDSEDADIAVDEVFMFVPDGSTLGIQDSSVKGGILTGPRCRVLGNFRADGDVLLGEGTTLYGALRVTNGNVELEPDVEVQGSLQADGHVIVGEGCQILGDLTAKSVEMYTSATVDGKILAEHGVTFHTEAQDRRRLTAEQKVEEVETGKAADLVDLLG